MTAKATCVSDAQARVVLPTAFANATLIIEQLSDIELRIRKTNTIQADETQFAEEQMTVLSDRDRDLFLEILDAPAEPNAALRTALAKHPHQHD